MEAVVANDAESTSQILVSNLCDIATKCFSHSDPPLQIIRILGQARQLSFSKNYVRGMRIRLLAAMGAFEHDDHERLQTEMQFFVSKLLEEAPSTLIPHEGGQTYQCDLEALLPDTTTSLQRKIFRQVLLTVDANEVLGRKSFYEPFTSVAKDHLNNTDFDRLKYWAEVRCLAPDEETVRAGLTQVYTVGTLELDFPDLFTPSTYRSGEEVPERCKDNMPKFCLSYQHDYYERDQSKMSSSKFQILLAMLRSMMGEDGEFQLWIDIKYNASKKFISNDQYSAGGIIPYAHLPVIYVPSSLDSDAPRQEFSDQASFWIASELMLAQMGRGIILSNNFVHDIPYIDQACHFRNEVVSYVQGEFDTETALRVYGAAVVNGLFVDRRISYVEDVDRIVENSLEMFCRTDFMPLDVGKRAALMRIGTADQVREVLAWSTVLPRTVLSEKILGCRRVQSSHVEREFWSFDASLIAQGNPLSTDITGLDRECPSGIFFSTVDAGNFLVTMERGIRNKFVAVVMTIKPVPDSPAPGAWVISETYLYYGRTDSDEFMDLHIAVEGGVETMPTSPFCDPKSLSKMIHDFAVEVLGQDCTVIDVRAVPKGEFELYN